MLCREAVDKCLRLLSFYESLGRLIRKSQINCRVTLPSVFISYSCLNIVPQTRRLKTTKIYSLTVLEARSKNDGRAMFHLKPEEEILFSLLASDSRRQSSRFIGFQMPHWSVCHCYLMAIIFLCVSLPSYGILSDSLFLLGHSHIRLRTHPTPVSVSHSVVSDSEPMDCSPPDSSVHGIFQANIPRILEQGAISFSRGSCQPRDQTWVSLITGIFFTIWATREALPTKVRIVKAMIFLVVIYRCESWTVKKAEHPGIDAF